MNIGQICGGSGRYLKHIFGNTEDRVENVVVLENNVENLWISQHEQSKYFKRRKDTKTTHIRKRRGRHFLTTRYEKRKTGTCDNLEDLWKERYRKTTKEDSRPLFATT